MKRAEQAGRREPRVGAIRERIVSVGRAALHPPCRVLCALALAVALGGCAAWKPSVKPYEREALADPLMSFSRDPVSDKYRQHVYDVREAARGAGISQGGGCGCN